MSSSALKYFACIILVSLSSTASAKETVWRDTPLNRVAALAVMQTLNAELLSHDSATLTLERWCDDHKLSDPAKISAERLKDVKPAPDPIREQLKVSPEEKLGYRHVLLKCGNLVLSEADNWFVPDRLTDKMNETLNTSDTPFGKVVLPLHFQRHTTFSELLWHPLPNDWTKGGAIPASTPSALEIPDTIFSHQALLSKPDGTPFSYVVENYKGNLLHFPPPAFPN